MRTVHLLLVSLLAAASCAPLIRVSLRVVPRDHHDAPAATKSTAPATTRSILVQVPRDLRPAAEATGADTKLNYVFPVLNLFFWAARGSAVTGNEHFLSAAWSELHQSLVDQLRASRLFAGIIAGGNTGTPGSPDYVLETEVLHLLASMYRASGGFVALGGSFVERHDFLPQATVTLRLRLRRGGTLVGERVVTEQQTGSATDDQRNMNRLVPTALEKALRRTRGMVASWVLEEESQALSSEQLLAEHEAAHGRGHTFVVQRVNPDRSATQLVTLECPSGKVVSSRVVEGLPTVGLPGDDLLSPLDTEGVRLPRRVYDALSRHLAQHFNLQRVDQLAVYHFLGVRPARHAATEPPPPPPTGARKRRRRLLL